MIICTERDVIVVGFSDEKINDQFLTIFLNPADINSEQLYSSEHRQFFSFSNELKSKINSFENLYGGMDKSMGKIFSLFSHLKLGENIFIFFSSGVTDELIGLVQIYLRQLNKGVNDEKAYKSTIEMCDNFYQIFGKVMGDYEMKLINPIKPMKQLRIGERIPVNKICRFCNKKNGDLNENNDKVTFRSTAHAIPEALGNKYIIGNEECDICNGEFASGIELDLINYCNVFRVFYQVEGKRGIPKIQYKNATIGQFDRKMFIHRKTSDKILGGKESIDPIKLVFGERINLMGIYRCLVKMALSVMDNCYLKYFPRTIKWVKGANFGAVPKVAVGILTGTKSEAQPSILLYFRKNDNLNIPYSVAEFRFCRVSFVYIIPFCDSDKNNFLDDGDFGDYWNEFKHYNKLAKSWDFKDFSKDKKINVNFNLKFNFRN